MIQDGTQDFYNQQAELARQYRLRPQTTMTATENIAASAQPESAKSQNHQQTGVPAQGVQAAPKAAPESFLDGADVQDESGVLAYYSREAVLACITAALESVAAPKAAPGERRNTKTHDLLSTVVGVLMGYREGAARQPYKPGSVVDKVVNEAVEHLKDWPYPEAAPQQEPYSIDTDPQGIRAIVADAITGALAFGAQGANPPPEGHWLTPFWEMAREEAMRTKPALLSRDTLYLLRRLLSNQHTLTGSEFRAELEKIVGEAYQQEAQEPYAYAVYFPDQPKVELVHELDDLIDDLTNRPHVVTKLYTAPQPEPAPLSQREEIAMIDAAMVEMANIVPPLRRSECASLIRAALAAQGGKDAG